MRNLMSDDEKEFMNKTMERVFDLIERSGEKDYPLEIKIGLSRSAIQNWRLKKSKAGTYSLAKVANYFNVSLDYLVGRETSATTEQSQQNIAYDATTAPLLNEWNGLTELQRQKVLTYINDIKGVNYNAAMDRLRKAEVAGKERATKEVYMQRQKKDV